MPTFDLICHPGSSPATRAVQRISVDLSMTPEHLLLRYRLSVPPQRLLLPPAAPGQSRRRDGLWQHTCFEFFVMANEDRATRGQPYREFNFSPTGAWAAYDFCAYRTPAPHPCPDLPPPECHIDQDAAQFAISVQLSRAALPPLPWHGQLSAVIIEQNEAGPALMQTVSGTQPAYWALAHVASAPDFHDTRAWHTLHTR